MKTIVILSDLQSPYHDVGATNAIKKFIRAYQPDVVATCGDEIDFPQISRWEEGGEGEWQQGRIRFLGEAWAEESTDEIVLSNLLSVLGNRKGPRAILKVG